MENKEIEKYAYLVLKYIHANQGLIGSKYLMYIVKKVLEDPMSIQNLTRKDGLYSYTAAHFNANPNSIERGIRHLSFSIYNTVSKKEYERIFGTTNKLPNKQFIETVCNIIRYERDKLDSTE